MISEIPPWCWLIAFVYDMERSMRFAGRSMVGEYAAELRQYEDRLARGVHDDGAPHSAGYRRYLIETVAHCRHALGLLVGRLGALNTTRRARP